MSNVVWHHATVTRARREAQNGHGGAIIWFTGLSGAAKSTLAHAVEEQLHQFGCNPYTYSKIKACLSPFHYLLVIPHHPINTRKY